jgi:DMSO/TMAO reductase YedYZ molybdopterin-dependent catalytic subunit
MKNESRRQFITVAAGAGALASLPLKKALAQTDPPGTISNDVVKGEKAKAMQWHSERPLTGSVPAHEHDFDATPNERMFIRNNHTTPVIDINKHTLTIQGLVDRQLSFSVFDLARNFKTVTMQGMLECAGSGRAAYQPRASGTPWIETGGMGCPAWGGVRLADLLRAAGVKPNAVHVAGEGGDPGVLATAAPLIRSIPMRKAMDESTLVAWSMNGQPLPWVHGYPLRMVVPGWVGSASVKWLHTLTVLDAPFKGPFMDSSYRYPRTPIAPGGKMPPDAVSAEAWPVKSIITSPAPNAPVRGTVQVRGRAWVGEGAVDRVEISTDEGKTWQRATLARADPLQPYAWRTFTYEYQPQRPGYVSFLARAWDERGNSQPAVPYWNPLGYFWNGWHRVGVVVEA